MFGATEETFKGNRILIAIIASITLFLIWAFVDTYAAGKAADNLHWVAIIILLGFLVYWLLSVEIRIYTDGFSSKTFLGEKEMRWDDVARFTYRSTRLRINFIPAGTYYHLKLEDTQGRKIDVGNRARGMERLSRQIINHTLPPLLLKVVEQFNSGVDVDFGMIKVNRTAGFKSKSLFGNIEVPFNEVIDYRIEKGQFHLFLQENKHAAISAPIGKVPNAFALLALLDSMYKRHTPAN